MTDFPTVDELQEFCEQYAGNAYHDVWVMYCASRSAHSAPEPYVPPDEIDLLILKRERDDIEKQLGRASRRLTKWTAAANVRPCDGKTLYQLRLAQEYMHYSVKRLSEFNQKGAKR